MAIFGIPYPSDAEAHDRKYTSAQIAAGDAILGTSGLAINAANSGLVAKVAGTRQITIQPCEALICGHKCISDAVETLLVDPGDATYPRIDIVVFESNSDTAVRNPRFFIVKGQPSSNPAAPALSSTAGLTQVQLATILVPQGMASLDAATLTDTRAWMRGKHIHAISDVTGMQAALDGKSNTDHSHTAFANLTAQSLALTAAIAEQQAKVVNVFLQKTSDALPSGATLAALPTGTLVLRYVP